VRIINYNNADEVSNLRSERRFIKARMVCIIKYATCTTAVLGVLHSFHQTSEIAENVQLKSFIASVMSFLKSGKLMENPCFAKKYSRELIRNQRSPLFSFFYRKTRVVRSVTHAHTAAEKVCHSEHTGTEQRTQTHQKVLGFAHSRVRGLHSNEDLALLLQRIWVRTALKKKGGCLAKYAVIYIEKEWHSFRGAHTQKKEMENASRLCKCGCLTIVG